VRRYEESFVERMKAYCTDKDVLEIGCGDGSRLLQAARSSRSWIGIDPDQESIDLTKELSIPSNVEFKLGDAAKLLWPDASFDVVVFTLSLHHMGMEVMPRAIGEAVRVLREDGVVLFLEPLPVGTFFEAELEFGCCDGDEREALARAESAMKSSDKLVEVEEFTDWVSVEYSSFDDFKDHVPIREETESQVEEYLARLEFRLDEQFRLNVFSVAVRS